MVRLWEFRVKPVDALLETANGEEMELLKTTTYFLPGFKADVAMEHTFNEDGTLKGFKVFECCACASQRILRD